MDNRRLGQLNITGFGTGVSPSVTVPDPKTSGNTGVDPLPSGSGGGNNTGNQTPAYSTSPGSTNATGFASLGFAPAVTTPSGLGVYGTPTNTAAQNYAAAREMGNPLPSPTGPSNAQGVGSFLNSFRFANASTPEQTRFNQLATQYGVNDAWSWTMANAWNQLGPQLREAMAAAGISSDDMNRIINTYGARTKDLGANSPYNYSANWLANAFAGFKPVDL